MIWSLTDSCEHKAIHLVSLVLILIICKMGINAMHVTEWMVGHMQCLAISRHSCSSWNPLYVAHYSCRPCPGGALVISANNSSTAQNKEVFEQEFKEHFGEFRGWQKNKGNTMYSLITVQNRSYESDLCIIVRTSTHL